MRHTNVKSVKSATDLLLHKTSEVIWRRGEAYANSHKVHLLQRDEKETEAVAQGTKPYAVHLKFAGSGMSRSCTCPYQGDVCKHMVATAIVWDEARGLARPSTEDIETETIPPPPVTRAQIHAVFASPLKADLDILRLAPESRGWSRPHSRLPTHPTFETNTAIPVTRQEVRKAFHEIKRWTNRNTYDPYFCAGEMTAAFCEVLRFMKTRLPVTSPLVAASVLRAAQQFHSTLVTSLIDDSDGHWQITEAHLHEMYEWLQETPVPRHERKDFVHKLQEFTDHKDDY